MSGIPIELATYDLSVTCGRRRGGSRARQQRLKERIGTTRNHGFRDGEFQSIGVPFVGFYPGDGVFQAENVFRIFYGSSSGQHVARISPGDAHVRRRGRSSSSSSTLVLFGGKKDGRQIRSRQGRRIHRAVVESVAAGIASGAPAHGIRFGPRVPLGLFETRLAEVRSVGFVRPIAEERIEKTRLLEGTRPFVGRELMYGAVFAHRHQGHVGIPIGIHDQGYQDATHVLRVDVQVDVVSVFAPRRGTEDAAEHLVIPRIEIAAGISVQVLRAPVSG
jgi:hypothetical protein